MNNDFIMKPKIDFCFKELMSDEKVRQGFISALLQLPPEEVADTQLLPTLLPLEYKDDKLELHVLELPELKAYNNPGNELLRWAKFFAAENKEEFQMISQGNEYLETAYDNLIKLSADEQKRLEYELRMKAIRDHNAYMEYAQKQGIEQGIKQGRQSGVSETVIELLQEYGNIPSDLKEQILQEQDLEQLKIWLKLAAKVSSIDEFKEKML